MKYFKLLAVIAVLAMGLSSCSKSNEVTTSSIAGNYVGTVKVLGYTDPAERAYVNLSRMSSDVVSFKFSSEAYNLDLNPINLIVENKNGVVMLTSQSSYAIAGSITNDVLTVTFGVGDYTYMFSGKKD